MTVSTKPWLGPSSHHVLHRGLHARVDDLLHLAIFFMEVSMRLNVTLS
jgi:hypothetical protein